MTMGTPLTNAPVYVTVAQVRFNAILKLAEFLPTIQERFRTSGFPDYAVNKVIVIQIANQNGQPVPTPGFQEHYAFRNIEKTLSFILETDKLSFQSTRYGTFERFSETFLQGLSIVHDVVRLDFTERIGMRYLDRVSPVGSDTLDQYLVPEVRGLSDCVGGTPLRSFYEVLSQNGDIKLLSRVITQTGPLAFPPDLMPGDMAIDPRFAAYDGLHAILDNDGFFDGRESYSSETVGRYLTAIHDAVTKAFRATVTPHALKVWE
jgi:uncharacterized protein (TIGR04255 family)